MSVRERLYDKFAVNSVTGCWDWTASKQPPGYGQMWNGERVEQAHRISFRLHCGEIPDGLEIHHECRNRSCVNPVHLRAVTHQVNVLAGDTQMARNAVKTE